MFKQYLTENLASIDPDGAIDGDITKADLIEIINDLDEDEYYPIMEILLSYIENTFDVDDIDGDGTEDIDETLADKLSEAKYFANKKTQVARNKKMNKSDKRKLAKKRKMAYKKNKAKVKRYNKKASKKRKSGKTVGGKRITKHR